MISWEFCKGPAELVGRSASSCSSVSSCASSHTTTSTVNPRPAPRERAENSIDAPLLR